MTTRRAEAFPDPYSLKENSLETLLFPRGACSFAIHIALEEAGVPFEIERVDLKSKTTESGAHLQAYASILHVVEHAHELRAEEAVIHIG